MYNVLWMNDFFLHFLKISLCIYNDIELYVCKIKFFICNCVSVASCCTLLFFKTHRAASDDCHDHIFFDLPGHKLITSFADLHNSATSKSLMTYNSKLESPKSIWLQVLFVMASGLPFIFSPQVFSYANLCCAPVSSQSPCAPHLCLPIGVGSTQEAGQGHRQASIHQFLVYTWIHHLHLHWGLLHFV